MKNKTFAIVAFVGIELLVASCTQIEVRRMPKEVIEGIPYALPKKTFLIAVEYELQECSAKLDGGKPVLTLAIAKTVTLTSTVDVDREQQYYIPYSSLRNWFKSTDITIQSNENQTLKGATVIIEDKTGSAITSAIGTAIRVASIATGVGMAAEGAEKIDYRNLYCSEAARNALDGIRLLKKKMKSADAKGAADDKSGANKADAQEPSDDNDIKLAQLKSQLVRKYLTSWTPTREEHSPISLFPDEALQAWLTESGRDVLLEADKTKLTISAEFVPNQEIPPPPTPKPDYSEGLLIREPIHGIIRVCEGTCPTGTDVTSVLKAEDHSIPQLGPFVSMPLRNRIFQSQTLTMELAESGAITKLGYKSNAVADARSQPASIAISTRFRRQRQRMTRRRRMLERPRKTPPRMRPPALPETTRRYRTAWMRRLQFERRGECRRGPVNRR